MGVWLMSFGLSKGGSSNPSKEDGSDNAVLVHSDDNNKELFTSTVRQLKLLNARFEEAFRTRIYKEDIEHNED